MLMLLKALNFLNIVKTNSKPPPLPGQGRAQQEEDNLS